MARTYARVKLTIWADQDFRDLTDTAQALYFRLLTSPTMNLCGVADWRPNRLAALTRGMTTDGVILAAKELEERGFVVPDETTEEILIRSFVRHDGLIATPNIAAAMVKDYAGTASATLRGVIVYELNRLHRDEPKKPGWVAAGTILSEPSVDPGNPSVKASGNPSVKASGKASTVPSAEASGNASDIPIPLPTPLDVPSRSTSAPKRGTRIHADFTPDAAMLSWAAEKAPDVDPKLATEEFVDYWRAVPGTKGVKLDWSSTWRNHMRKRQQWADERGTRGPQRPGARATAARPSRDQWLDR